MSISVSLIWDTPAGWRYIVERKALRMEKADCPKAVSLYGKPTPRGNGISKFSV